VETEADQLSWEVTMTEMHPNNINWEDKILPRQKTDVSHTVRARNKATGVLQEHNYLTLLRQHYLNINT
jgi:hypothetical protein